jgi:hypothetical protein
MFMQCVHVDVHAAWISNIDMQQEYAAWTKNMNTMYGYVPGHASMKMQH